MIGDEDKYATSNELTGYICIVLILMIFHNWTNTDNDRDIIKAMSTHVKSNHKIWRAQIKRDSVQDVRWDKQYLIDSTFIELLNKR